MKVVANDSLMQTRAEQGLTLRELSKKAGVPSSTISRAENGLPLSVKSAGKLCRALEKSFKTLFKVEKEKK